jgi:hypothetical protein
MKWTFLALLFVAVVSASVSEAGRYEASFGYHKPQRFPMIGRGLYDFLFGPWPPRPQSEDQRPVYNRPKPDFANDKVPDYDLYLLG